LDVVALLAVAVPSVLPGQGVAVSGRKPRASLLVKGDRVPPKVRFVDAGERIPFRHSAGEPIDKKYILEATGGGVALFDYDNDGLLDIFFVNGTRWQPEKGETRETSRLLRNRGGLKFEDKVMALFAT
jgi:hypothetical protein